jgi:hypothetical protein
MAADDTRTVKVMPGSIMEDHEREPPNTMGYWNKMLSKGCTPDS